MHAAKMNFMSRHGFNPPDISLHTCKQLKIWGKKNPETIVIISFSDKRNSTCLFMFGF